MRKVWRWLVPLALLVGMATAAHAADEQLKKLTLDEVSSKVGKPNVYIFDNNSKESFAQAHVPTAKWLDYDSVTASALPADKAATLIFYCANPH